jgi:hypothetical protein
MLILLKKKLFKISVLQLNSKILQSVILSDISGMLYDSSAHINFLTAM